jgi:drug/metabolite transporter (DMT)-like permease
VTGRDLPPLGPGGMPAGAHGVVINGTRTDWTGRYDDVLLLTLSALPLALLVVWLLARRRRRTKSRPTGAWVSSLSEVGLVYGTAPWVWLTMAPGSGAGTVHGRLSLVPFRDLQTMPGYQVAGNLLVLAALGFFAPLRWKALRSIRRVLALGAACSVLIEATQYLLPLGRVASIDDVLLNTVGTILAALVSRPWWAATTTGLPRQRRTALTGTRQV